MGKFSHLDENNQPQMVDVGNKQETKRIAKAACTVKLPKEIISQFKEGDIDTKKGPVFQTAILAGIMGAKKTSDLIPLCHPLAINKCDIQITVVSDNTIEIVSTVSVSGKTGVEMEALVGANVAALTIYDMCKGFSHDIIIKESKLLEKTGGKSDFKRN
jgi:cyclic pyranopterin phosphate synthase